MHGRERFHARGGGGRNGLSITCVCPKDMVVLLVVWGYIGVSTNESCVMVGNCNAGNHDGSTFQFGVNRGIHRRFPSTCSATTFRAGAMDMLKSRRRCSAKSYLV